MLCTFRSRLFQSTSTSSKLLKCLYFKVFAFACNVKNLTQLPLPITVLGRAAKFFTSILFSTQEACDQGRTYFIGDTKKSLRKNYFITCYSRRVCNMTKVIQDKQHSQHPKKQKKHPETWTQVRRRPKIQGSKERELI